MATRQEDIARTAIGSPGFDAARIVRTGLSQTAAWLNRAMLGGSTPRSYRREGYPELELHQLISGRKDRFDRE